MDLTEKVRIFDAGGLELLAKQVKGINMRKSVYGKDNKNWSEPKLEGKVRAMAVAVLLGVENRNITTDDGVSKEEYVVVSTVKSGHLAYYAESDASEEVREKPAIRSGMLKEDEVLIAKQIGLYNKYGAFDTKEEYDSLKVIVDHITKSLVTDGKYNTARVAISEARFAQMSIGRYDIDVAHVREIDEHLRKFPASDKKLREMVGTVRFKVSVADIVTRQISDDVTVIDAETGEEKIESIRNILIAMLVPFLMVIKMRAETDEELDAMLTSFRYAIANVLVGCDVDGEHKQVKMIADKLGQKLTFLEVKSVTSMMRPFSGLALVPERRDEMVSKLITEVKSSSHNLKTLSEGVKKLASLTEQNIMLSTTIAKMLPRGVSPMNCTFHVDGKEAIEFCLDDDEGLSLPHGVTYHSTGEYGHTSTESGELKKFDDGVLKVPENVVKDVEVVVLAISDDAIRKIADVWFKEERMTPAEQLSQKEDFVNMLMVQRDYNKRFADYGKGKGLDVRVTEELTLSHLSSEGKKVLIIGTEYYGLDVIWDIVRAQSVTLHRVTQCVIKGLKVTEAPDTYALNALQKLRYELMSRMLEFCLPVCLNIPSQSPIGLAMNVMGIEGIRAAASLSAAAAHHIKGDVFGVIEDKFPEPTESIFTINRVPTPTGVVLNVIGADSERISTIESENGFVLVRNVAIASAFKAARSRVLTSTMRQSMEEPKLLMFYPAVPVFVSDLLEEDGVDSVGRLSSGSKGKMAARAERSIQTVNLAYHTVSVIHSIPTEVSSETEQAASEEQVYHIPQWGEHGEFLENKNAEALEVLDTFGKLDKRVEEMVYIAVVTPQCEGFKNKKTGEQKPCMKRAAIVKGRCCGQCSLHTVMEDTVLIPTGGASVQVAPVDAVVEEMDRQRVSTSGDVPL